ncbi:hypothetical protein H8S77_28100 [Parabacteroides sp. BX2]|jgi:uncharacterized protein YhaN|uniref:Uncharacterized protein n=1 Tax=Parabacteroides segnis TaxID=2763058 RepID=A0ABR7EAA8_9BACT|nr:MULTISPECIES: hypothetical protein [Parabacteroides]MBC5646712.1 hypothetical protein [Parabacteroides segnis]
MGKNNQEVENIRLREEVKQLKKANKSLEKKLATANSKKQELQKRTKKKESQIIELSNEQLESLSNRLKDIDIRNLLPD